MKYQMHAAEVSSVAAHLNCLFEPPEFKRQPSGRFRSHIRFG